MTAGTSEFRISHRNHYNFKTVIAHNNKFCNGNSDTSLYSYSYANNLKCNWCNKPFPEILKILISIYE